jgi:hypothetical protein
MLFTKFLTKKISKMEMILLVRELLVLLKFVMEELGKESCHYNSRENMLEKFQLFINFNHLFKFNLKEIKWHKFHNKIILNLHIIIKVNLDMECLLQWIKTFHKLNLFWWIRIFNHLNKYMEILYNRSFIKVSKYIPLKTFIIPNYHYLQQVIVLLKTYISQDLLNLKWFNTLQHSLINRLVINLLINSIQQTSE